MIYCNDAQNKTILRNLYITDNLVDFEKVYDLYETIMLISASCGRGKTTYALNTGIDGLLYDINKQREKLNLFDRNLKDIQPHEVLFLFSRTNILDQVEKKPNVIKACENDFNDNIDFMRDREIQGKILVQTAHQFGEWCQKGLVKYSPKVIGMDELHSLLAEPVFADSLLYTLNFIEDHYNEMIKIGLTATPQYLIDYIEKNCKTKFKFQVVDCGDKIGAKYKAQNVKILVNGKGKTVLNEYINKIDSTHKAIYYVQSAKQCYQLAKEYGDKAGFIISKWNDTATNEDGELLVNIMDQQGIRDYIINNEKLPNDIDIIFINASCREGMNIKDDNVKFVLCEAVDLITIEQVFGRIRNNTEEFIVIANFNNYRQNEKNIQDFLDFLKQYEDNPHDTMLFRAGQQDRDSKMQKYVFQYHDEYKINSFAKAYLQYIQESYIQISNRCDKKYITQIGDRKMLMTEDYFNQLSKYAENGEITIKEVITATIETNHENAVEKFREIEKEWLNKPIGKEEKKELCAVLSVMRSKGQNASWNTVKKMLVDAGYTIKQKRIGSKNYDVILKA